MSDSMQDDEDIVLAFVRIIRLRLSAFSHALFLVRPLLLVALHPDERDREKYMQSGQQPLFGTHCLVVHSQHHFAPCIVGGVLWTSVDLNHQYEYTRVRMGRTKNERRT